MPATATSLDSDQSETRSLGGVLVHVLALFTSFVGPAIVYAFSEHRFTRENARRTLNWHATLAILWTPGLMLMSLIVLVAGDDVTVNEEPIDPVSVPSALETALTFVAIILAFAMSVAVLVTFAYAVVGTLKALSGSVWSYPGAVDIVGRLR